MFVDSVQIIIRLDSQSQSQMFTLFFGRHVGGAKTSTNMATPGSVNFAQNIEYQKFGKTRRP